MPDRYEKKEWADVFAIYDGTTRYGTMKFRLWINPMASPHFEPTNEADLAKLCDTILTWLNFGDAAQGDDGAAPRAHHDRTTNGKNLAPITGNTKEDDIPF